MEKANLSSLRLFLLVLLLSASTGIFYSLTQKSDKGGFISPVVLGTTTEAQSGPAKKPFDLFGGLKLPGKLVEKMASLPGVVLGEKTKRVAVAKATLTPFLSPTPSVTPVLNQGSPTLTPTVTPTPTVSQSLATVTPSPTPVSLTAAQTAVTGASQSVIGLLIAKNYAGLYALLSDEFKSYFSEAAFADSLSSSVDVLSGAVLGPPEVHGAVSEWAEQSEELTLSDGSKKIYNLVWHKEGGSWKLFATEEKT